MNFRNLLCSSLFGRTLFRVASIVTVMTALCDSSSLLQAAQSGDWTYTDMETFIRIDGYTGSPTAPNYRVSIPSTLVGKPVQTIGDYAFGNTTNTPNRALIRWVTIPSGVTAIGSSSFSSLPAMTRVDFPDTLVSIGSEAFHECSSLGSVAFPATLTTIGSYAFENCSALTTATLNEGLFSMGNYAFLNAGLTSVTIPASLNTIPWGAFLGCESLESVVIRNGSGAKTIETSAFQRCSKLKSVDFPDTLTSIGSEAFNECSSLSSVAFPTTLTTIGSYAFVNCSALTTATLNEGLNSMGSYAFWDAGLTSVTIPASLNTIPWGAFLRCESLESVVIRNGSGAKIIEGSAFQRCSKLKSVDFPDTLTSIGSEAFDEFRYRIHHSDVERVCE
jgi:hypothetical protein